ncbi:MAG TPA: diguanylate cyclase [Vicinamibacteria bacterium]|nr:diguanylate cyclase [Vicinamibacteria bacterium]
MSAPKVLVADDSPLVLRMIEKMLQGAGFGVVTAKDGLEAIEKAFAEDLALVILDVMMPRMNGYQACRLLKSEPSTRGLPVVILTSKDQAGDRFWGLETGADHYVTKDADPQGILELVRKIAAAPPPQKGPARRDSIDILSRVNELLDRKLFEATLLSELGAVAKSFVNFDETFASVMRVLTKVVDFSVGAMAFADEDELDMFLAVQRPVAPLVLEETKARLLEVVSRERGPAPFGRVQARLFAVGSAQGAEETSLGGFAAYPIRTNQSLAGVLAFAGKAAARIAGDSESFLQTAAQQAKIVMENSRLFDKVKSLSVRDSLTGLFNHRHTIDQVASEFGRVGRYEGGVSLLMVDIDHLKRVNDELGHPAGDLVLREVARLLKDSLRVVDSIGRYGGEEFACILPHTNHEEARQTAERLRNAIAEHPFRVGNREFRVTVSVGVATYPSARVDSAGGLIREADKALYRAKEAGRNRVA